MALNATVASAARPVPASAPGTTRVSLLANDWLSIGYLLAILLANYWLTYEFPSEPEICRFEKIKRIFLFLSRNAGNV